MLHYIAPNFVCWWLITLTQQHFILLYAVYFSFTVVFSVTVIIEG